MTLHIAVIGIDGSGKSTMGQTLPALLAAKFNITCGCASEQFFVSRADEDGMGPHFYPRGFPLSARLAAFGKRMAKKFVNNKIIYPPCKLLHMLSQDAAAYKISKNYGADVMVSDGNALLLSMGRAANYLHPTHTASDVGKLPDESDLCYVFSAILDGKQIPQKNQNNLPNVRPARIWYRLMTAVGIKSVWLPDIVIYLNLSPEKALERIALRGEKKDRHENPADLTQAHEMYRRTLAALKKYRPSVEIIEIAVDNKEVGQTLSQIITALAPKITAHRRAVQADGKKPLGTTAEITAKSFWKIVFSYRYLVKYLLFTWFRGSWREITFLFSPPGRMLLKEGYSAGVMKIIYEHDSGQNNLFVRAFQNYPLHRAVSERLQILTGNIERILWEKLAKNNAVKIFSAPSGFGYDIFVPLQTIITKNPAFAKKITVIASDLDPHDVIGQELSAKAQQLGISFHFFLGDMTTDVMKSAYAVNGPYDLALFVGLSGWLPKPLLLGHLATLRTLIKDDGVLVTDSFTADAYALSGHLVGYKGNYYSPKQYAALLDYAGFRSSNAEIFSGSTMINHVIIIPPRISVQRLQKPVKQTKMQAKKIKRKTHHGT